MMTAKGEALVRDSTAVASIGWGHFCKLLASRVGPPKQSNWEGVVQGLCKWVVRGVVRGLCGQNSPRGPIWTPMPKFGDGA